MCLLIFSLPRLSFHRHAFIMCVVLFACLKLTPPDHGTFYQNEFRLAPIYYYKMPHAHKCRLTPKKLSSKIPCTQTRTVQFEDRGMLFPATSCSHNVQLHSLIVTNTLITLHRRLRFCSLWKYENVMCLICFLTVIKIFLTAQNISGDSSIS